MISFWKETSPRPSGGAEALESESFVPGANRPFPYASVAKSSSRFKWPGLFRVEAAPAAPTAPAAPPTEAAPVAVSSVWEPVRAKRGQASQQTAPPYESCFQGF